MVKPLVGAGRRMCGVVSFLVWLWLSNLVLLYGVALDAELHTSEP